ncbi:MAG: hypothetical protein AB2L14_23540 [Candidatus Xenobiia bacterium LiM19]
MDPLSIGTQKAPEAPAPLPPALQSQDQDVKNLGKKILDYFEPRPATAGDLEYSSPSRAAMGGGIQGFFAGGPYGAAGGATGGYIGTRIGEEMHSLKHAIAASAVSGAGSMLLITSALPYIIGSPSSVGTFIAAMGLLGGASGAAGSLIGVLENERHRDAIKEGVHNLLSGDTDGKEAAAADSQDISLLRKAGNLAEKALHATAEALKPITDRIPGKVLAALTGAGIGAAAGALGGPMGIGIGAAAGAASGFSGAALAENMSSVKEQGTKKALMKGVGLSSALTASAGALAGAGIIAAISGNPAMGLALLGASLVGALSGTAGALSGSRLAKIRDGSAGGFMAGMLTNSFLGNSGALSLTPLAGSVGGAVGVKGKNTFWKAVLGGLSGGAVGAATGIIGGPISAAIGAAIGAGSGIAGALAGTKLHQGIRNLSEDIQKKISSAADSVTGTLIDKLGPEKGVAVAGFLSGAIGSLPLAVMGGLVFGPAGILLPTVASGALGAGKLLNQVKDVSLMGMVQKQYKEHGPSLEDLTDCMCRMAYPRLMPQLQGMPEEEQKQQLIAFAQSTYRELQKVEPLINRIEGAVCGQLYKDLKKELKHHKTDEEKEKFLEEKISAGKPQLAGIVINQVIAIMSAAEQNASAPAPAPAPAPPPAEAAATATAQ